MTDNMTDWLGSSLRRSTHEPQCSLMAFVHFSGHKFQNLDGLSALLGVHTLGASGKPTFEHCETKYSH